MLAWLKGLERVSELLNLVSNFKWNLFFTSTLRNFSSKFNFSMIHVKYFDSFSILWFIPTYPQHHRSHKTPKITVCFLSICWFVWFNYSATQAHAHNSVASLLSAIYFSYIPGKWIRKPQGYAYVRLNIFQNVFLRNLSATTLFKELFLSCFFFSIWFEDVFFWKNLRKTEE